MKYLKLSLMALLAGVMFSCSEEDTAAINSGDATVGFAQAEYNDVDERTSSLMIPVSLTGEHNGDVKLNVVVKEVHGENVVVDETVVLTSNDLVMPAGVDQVNVEVYMYTGTLTETPGRYYVLEIASAEGAKVGTSTTRVNLVETPDPMDKLRGTWTMSGDQRPFQFTIESDPNDPDGSLGLLLCTTNNFDGQGLPASWNMKVMGSSVQFVLDKTIATGIDFGMPEWGKCSIRFGHFTMSGGQLGLGQGAINGSWNSEYTEVKFDEAACLGTWIYDENGANTQNIFTLYQNVTFTRVQ